MSCKAKNNARRKNCASDTKTLARQQLPSRLLAALPGSWVREATSSTAQGVRRSRETTDLASDAPPAKQRVATWCCTQAAIARTEPAATASSKVQKPRRHTSKTKLGLYHVSRRDFVARPASLPEREQRLVLLRPGPLPTPDAGKASLHAGPTARNLGRRARRRLSKHSHVPGEEQIK